MFDFLKKKPYTVTQENGMEKLITAADMKKDAEEALKALEALPENYIKDLIDYTKSSIEHENISKEFLKALKKLVDAVSTKEAKKIQKNLSGDETPAPKQEKKDTPAPKKEEKSNEALGGDILNLGGDVKDEKKEASVEKDSIVKTAADTNPASSKYRAEGIKEKLLEINKEVAVKSDNKVQNIGNNTKGIITPGDKGTIVKVKEETVKPDIVVENVKIKIIRDDGEFEKLFPEKNIKFPKGDKVVLKASLHKKALNIKDNLTDEEKVKVTEIVNDTNKNPEEKQNELNNKNLGKKDLTSEASIYNQVMNTVFNRSAETEIKDENKEKFKEELEADVAEILK